MATTTSSYDFIKGKIDSLKTAYPSLRSKSDDYVFSALCIKANLYKNPALILDENDFTEMIVDGRYDGGIDVLLTDPNSEESDLVIGQSKFYKAITHEDVQNAVLKMALFLKDMQKGSYEQVNTKVQRRFIKLNSDLSDDAKIRFVFYTSAPQSGINRSRIEKRFREQFSDSSRLEISFFFGKDLEEEIKESESRRATVESGKIYIDETNNCLWYEDNAAIVNASAFSVKELYAEHGINLLSRNLRYYIAGKDIDRGIADTIENHRTDFWFKNNGLTIICDDFKVDGRVVKLRNFSIINGGQTTYMLSKSRSIDKGNDLFLPCKIIKISGDNEDERNKFSLEIAKAANTQKPIKPVDLKSNSPEQVRFARTMREVGIFYQTKRGEVVPKQYKDDYLNTDLLEIGKLCLAGLFQLPCTSRNKPSSLYLPKYYDVIFNGNHEQVAKLCRELLYIDYYFRKNFQKEFERSNTKKPDADRRITFVNNARTLCIAFVSFASRYKQGNIKEEDLQTIFDASRTDESADKLYRIFSNLNGINYFLPKELFDTKDEYDRVLSDLFKIIIEAGIVNFGMETRHDSTLTATNYLKRDKNYYAILEVQWATISSRIMDILSFMD